MDLIAFEKVAISEAKAVLDNNGMQEKEEIDWTSNRRSQSPADLRLNDATYKWVLTLPTEVWPLWVMKHYPRVANKLADTWGTHGVCETLFVDLLLDHRGTRKGFPVNVSREIMALKLYFESRSAIS
ncbi:hypothetical protein ACVBEF_09005 [Glaciimonas sp. GG7]